ncbi:MAG: 6-bladed beta-propeller, partial [Muribaculaceae bacterium]|nr:6-bladed beta-propeller [Muribaculaceae bacterium]
GGDIVVLDIKALQSLPVEEFDFASNPAIASIEYFQPADSLVFPFGLPVIGDSWVALNHDYAIIFDTKSGHVLSLLEKCGQGPEEFVQMAGLAIDSQAETCNVLTSESPSKIKTYAYNGDYLGDIQISGKIHPASQSFMLHNDSCYFVEQSSARRVLSGKTDDPFDLKPYLLIDRKSGEVKQLPIERLDPKICRRYVPKTPDVFAPNMIVNIRGIHGGENNIIISEFSHDTIFSVTDCVVEPIAVKKNWSKDYDEPDLVSVLYAGSRYMIFELLRKETDHSAETVSVNDSKSGTYIYDREKKEFHRYNDPGWFESNGHLYVLKPVYKLMDEVDNGEINDPKLLDLIGKSNLESNFVWVIYHIAE